MLPAECGPKPAFSASGVYCSEDIASILGVLGYWNERFLLRSNYIGCSGSMVCHGSWSFEGLCVLRFESYSI